MIKIKIFEAIFGSVGWKSLEEKVNNFSEKENVINILQSSVSDRLIVTVVYHDKEEK